jgi:hypothetical protein
MPQPPQRPSHNSIMISIYSIPDRPTPYFAKLNSSNLQRAPKFPDTHGQIQEFRISHDAKFIFYINRSGSLQKFDINTGTVVRAFDLGIEHRPIKYFLDPNGDIIIDKASNFFPKSTPFTVSPNQKNLLMRTVSASETLFIHKFQLRVLQGRKNAVGADGIRRHL